MLQQEGDLVEAHELAKQGAQAFPEHVRRQDVLQPRAADRGQVVRRSPPSGCGTSRWPTIQVRYRNLTQVYFRVVRDDWVERIKSQAVPARVARRRASARPCWPRSRTWSGRPSCRPPTISSERTEELPAPKDLKPGFYFLLASHDPGFGEQNNVVTFTDVLGEQPGAGDADPLGRRR